ncbi:MAG: NUDIX hydrolase [Microbacterium sp.]
MEWERLGSRLAYDGWVKVRRDTYRLPNGVESDWDVIESADAVAILAITPDAEVLTFTQFRSGPARVLQEAPGGAIEAGEPVVDAARRKLREETGYAADHFIDAGGAWDSSNATRRKSLVFAVGARRVQEQSLDAEEFGEVSTISLDAFAALVASGELTDAGIIAFALLRLRRGAIEVPPAARPLLDQLLAAV